MNKIETLLNNIAIAKDALEEEETKRDEFLEPILTILKATGDGISSCSLGSGGVYISRTGSCRGYRWDDDYTFPISIFSANDPISAAKDYMDQQKKKEEQNIRREKLSTIKRLQKELE